LPNVEPHSKADGDADLAESLNLEPLTFARGEDPERRTWDLHHLWRTSSALGPNPARATEEELVSLAKSCDAIRVLVEEKATALGAALATANAEHTIKPSTPAYPQPVTSDPDGEFTTFDPSLVTDAAVAVNSLRRLQRNPDDQSARVDLIRPRSQLEAALYHFVKNRGDNLESGTFESCWFHALWRLVQAVQAGLPDVAEYAESDLRAILSKQASDATAQRVPPPTVSPNNGPGDGVGSMQPEHGRDVEDRWLTVTQAACVAGVARGVISRAADRDGGDHKLKSNGKSGRGRRIDRIDLTRWILVRSNRSTSEESDEKVEALWEKASQVRRGRG
jgi:hypothetical protein